MSLRLHISQGYHNTTAKPKHLLLQQQHAYRKASVSYRYPISWWVPKVTAGLLTLRSCVSCYLSWVVLLSFTALATGIRRRPLLQLLLVGWCSTPCQSGACSCSSDTVQQLAAPLHAAAHTEPRCARSISCCLARSSFTSPGCSSPVCIFSTSRAASGRRSRPFTFCRPVPKQRPQMRAPRP